jgi:hypothetical protein
MHETHLICSLLILDAGCGEKLGGHGPRFFGGRSSHLKTGDTIVLKTLAIAIVLVGLPPSPVTVAQDVFVPPVTTADPGYLFANERSPRAHQSDARTDLELDTEAQARIRAAVEALVPEYNARLERDGEDRANAWIRRKAFELGQREAELTRRRLGLD